MPFIEGNLVKVEKLVSIDGGKLVVSLGSKKAKIAPLRIIFAIVGVLIALYYYNNSHDLLLSLILGVLLVGAFLFGDLDQMAKNSRRSI